MCLPFWVVWSLRVEGEDLPRGSSMLYLLDANVLITAHNGYYALNRVPEFWSWLMHHGAEGNVKIPQEMHREIRDGRDALAVWVARKESMDALLLDEEADQESVSDIINRGYAPDLTDDEVENMGLDPMLIAYAMADTNERCVVTGEISKRTQTRGNRKVPDVCADLGVQCINAIGFLDALNFRTSWDAPRPAVRRRPRRPRP